MSFGVREYAGGFLAGAANVVSGFPFDTCKVRLQASPDRYKSALDCFMTIIRREGASALFRGMSPPLVGGAVETGLNYWVYSWALRYLAATDGAQHGDVSHSVNPPLTHISAAAAISGVALSFVLSPVEMVKCRLQLGALDRHHAYKGPLDVMRAAWRSEGPRSLTRGLSGTLAREVPGNAIYFSMYHGLRREADSVFDSNKQLTGAIKGLYEATSAIACGGTAGVVMWAIVFPIDAAKTRIQVAWPGSRHDTGLVRQLINMYAKGSVPCLYSGLRPTLLRAFPANACQWGTWEACRYFFDSLEKQ